MEKLINSIIEYINNTASSMFNPLVGRTVSALSKIWIENTISKPKYKMIIDGFTDSEGNIVNSDEIFSVFKSLMDEKPIIIYGIKFNGNDIEEIKKIFKSK